MSGKLHGPFTNFKIYGVENRPISISTNGKNHSISAISFPKF